MRKPGSVRQENMEEQEERVGGRKKVKRRKGRRERERGCEGLVKTVS